MSARRGWRDFAKQRRLQRQTEQWAATWEARFAADYRQYRKSNPYPPRRPDREEGWNDPEPLPREEA